MLSRLQEATAYIRSRSKIVPSVGVVLGSGLGDVVASIASEAEIPYGSIPHAPSSSVIGHSGKLILGHCDGVPVAVMQGRVHYYEGYTLEEVTFLTRVLASLGTKRAIVTNAAGGVNIRFSPGDLMLISDHINMLGGNPLRGHNHDELGVRFPDMSDAYTLELRAVARRIAESKGIDVKEGVYLAVSGPSYETPAEIRAFRTLGADAVGMSTVPEVIVFAHMQIPVVGVSCITNMAAGVLPSKLDHHEVLETTTRVRKKFTELIVALIPAIAPK